MRRRGGRTAARSAVVGSWATLGMVAGASLLVATVMLQVARADHGSASCAAADDPPPPGEGPCCTHDFWYAGTRCCDGAPTDVPCECAVVNDQAFGEYCTFHCKPHLCHGHGVCNTLASNGPITGPYVLSDASLAKAPTLCHNGLCVDAVNSCKCQDPSTWEGPYCSAQVGVASCTDLYKNGDETDMDCGGSCSASGNTCSSGKTCAIAGDCDAGLACLTDSTCGALIVFGSGSPAATPTETGASVSVTLDAAGKVHWVLVPRDATAPSVAEVTSGTAAGGSAATASGFEPGTAASSFTVAISGLVAATDYDMYFVARDDAATPNVQTSTTKLQFSTTADATPPTWQSGFPSVTGVTDKGLQVKANLNEPADFFYSILPSAAAAPSAADVVAGSAAGAAVQGSGDAPTALTDATATVTSGLAHSTAYKVYVVARDKSPAQNAQSSATALDATTTADTSAPAFIATYPSFSSITDASVQLDVQLDEAGEFFWCLKENNAAAPSVSDLVAQTCGANNVDKGSVSVATASTTTSASMTGLAHSTDYDLYVVARDGAGTPNVQAAATKVEVTTASDATPPSFEASFPATSSVTDSGASLDVQLNEPGTAFFCVVADGAAAPTAAEVKGDTCAGSLDSGSVVVAAAATTASATIAGLQHTSPFDVYVVAQDAHSTPNVQAAPTKVDLLTAADASAPTFMSGYPAVAGLTDTSGAIEVQLDEAGVFYYVVVAQGAAAPSVAEVKAGTAQGGASALHAGSASVSAASTTASDVIPVGTFAHATAHDVYVVAEDAAAPAPNVQASASTMTLTTLADATPPAFEASFPTVDTVQDTSVRVNVQLNEPGTFYFVAVARDATAPTAAEVKAGTAAGGAAANAAGSKGVATATTTYSATIAGLPHATAHDAYVVAEDAHSTPNLQAAPTKVQFTTTGDAVVPTYITAFPTVDGVTDSQATFNVQLDEAGTFYWVVVASGATAPTAAEVAAGTASGGAAAIAAGSAAVSAASTTASDSVAAGTLAASTGYDGYVVAEDAYSTPNRMAAATKLAFTTNADATAPSFIAAYPAVPGGSISDAQATLEVQLDEAGTYHWVCLARGATAPNVAEVQAGTGAAGASPISAGSTAVGAASTTVTSTVTGLAASTDYDVYVVAQDTQGTPNVQSAATLVAFSTGTDTSPPVILAGFPTVSAITDTSGTVEVRLNEPGDFFYVVVTQGSPAPSVAEVIAGTAAGGGAAAASGNADVTIATTSVIPVGSLNHDTNYDVYVAARDKQTPTANVQTAVTSTTFKTLADATAPKFGTGSPAVDQITDSTARVGVELNEIGKFYFVILNAAASAPSVAEVVGGKAAGGAPAVASGSAVVAAGGTAYYATATGLEHGTSYVAHVVAEDDQSPSTNLQAAVATASFSTAADATPPTFNSGFPKAASVTDTSVTVQVALNEAGSFYFVVLADGAAAPSAAEVVAGTASGGAAAISSGSASVSAADTLASATGGSLMHGTSYDAYVVAQDAATTPNVQATATLLEFTSGADATAPTFVTGFPVVSGITDSGAQVNVQLDEIGTFYWIACKRGDPTPSASNVKAGIVPGGTKYGSGSQPVTAAATDALVTLAGLPHGTDVDLWVVAADDTTPTPNTQAAAVKVQFSTLADGTAPAFASGFPKVTSVMDSQATVQVQMDEPGSVYFVVVSDAAAAPSSAEVKAGTGSGGAAAITSGTAVVSTAGITVSTIATGLDHSTAYDFYVVAQDAFTPPNLQPSPSLVESTTAADATAPSFVVGFPAVSDIADQTAKISVQLNEAGQFHWLVVEAGGSTPTASQVANGQSPDGAAAVVASGSKAVSAAASTAAVTATGLSHSTNYELYVAAADDHTTPNLQAVATKVSFTTVSDASPPTFGAGYPQVANVLDITASVQVTLDEPGKYYYVVLTNDAAAPTAAEVKAGTGAAGGSVVDAGSRNIVAAGSVGTATASNLVHSTDFDLWIVAEDNAAGGANLQTTPTLVEFKTASDATAPMFVSSTPTVSGTTDVSAVVNVELDEAGTFHWIVVPRNAGTPSASEVRSGAAAGGASPTAAGTKAVAAASTNVAAVMAGLTHSTDFTVYVVAEDDHTPTANAQIVPVAVDFTTLGDATAPTFNAGYPKASSVQDKSFSIDVQLNEAGRFYYVVVPQSAAAPTSTEVKAGTAAGGVAALATGTAQVHAGSATASGASTGTLPHTTTVDVWIVAEDAATPTPNLQASPQLLQVTTAADATPPVYVDTFPKMTSVLDLTAMVGVQLKETGKFYWCVVPAASAAVDPDAATVATLSCPSAVDDGSKAVTAVSTTAASSVFNLVAATDYVMYVVAEDTHAPTPNRQTTIQRITFTTLADATPPTFSSTYPKMSGITDVGGNLLVRQNEPGMFFYVVVPDGAAAPTSAEVVNGEASGGGVAIAAGSASVAAAGTVASAAVSGLTHDVPYDAFVVAKDSFDNLQVTPKLVKFTTGADATPPAFVAGYPGSSGLTDSEFSVDVQLNEPGRFDFVVLPAGAAAPSAAEVKAGTGAGGSPVFDKGSEAVAAAGTTVGAKASGLAHATTYDVYVVAEDDHSTPNKQAVAVLLQVTTKADATPPTFVTTFPKINNVKDSAFDLLVQLNEAGDFHYVVVANDAPMPNVFEVLAGTGAAGAPALAKGESAVPAASTTVTATVTGLVHSSSFDVYVVGKDSHTPANVMGVVSKVDVTTAEDATPPTFSAGFPNLANPTDVGGTLKVKMDEPGTFYFAVMPDGAAAPTVAHVKVGSAGGALATGNAAITDASTVAEVVVTGLSYDTPYDLYVVAQDDHSVPNLQSSVTKVDVATGPDATAPQFITGFPSITGVTDKGGTLNVQLNEPGTFYYVVVGVGDSAPASGAVRAGTGASGSTAFAHGSVTVSGALQLAAIEITTLLHSTQYAVYVVAEDNTPNVQVTAQMLTINTGPDQTAPVFQVGYPALPASDIIDVGATLNVQLDEAGSFFWAVVPNDAAAPTTAALRAQAVAGSLAAGSAAVIAPATTASVQIRGLNHETMYDVYVVAQDDHATPNIQATPLKRDLTTGPDATPPKYVDGFPTVSAVVDDGATLNVQINEPGSFYYVVVAGGSAPPTAGEVRSGTGGGGSGALVFGSAPVSKASTTVAVTLSGLDHTTRFDVWVAAQDIRNNLQADPLRVVLNTAPDATPPVFGVGFPKIELVTDQGFTLKATLDEPGSFFYVVLPRNAQPPQVANIKAGEGAAGVSATAKGSAGVPTAREVASTVVTGLKHSTEYDLYVAAQDDHAVPNAQIVPQKLSFSTGPDMTPPTLSPGYPGLVSLTDISVKLRIKMSELGRAYYIVAVGGSPTPTGSQVKAGVAATGPAIATGFIDVTDLSIESIGDVAGLTHSTTYEFYVAAEDVFGNLMKTPSKLDFTTAGDQHAPNWISAYPRVVDMGDTYASLQVQADEPANYYFVVLPDGHAAPSIAQVKAAYAQLQAGATLPGLTMIDAGAGVVAQKSVTATSGLTNMQIATNYDLYIVARDTALVPNEQVSVTLVEFRTRNDATPPILAYQYPAVIALSDWAASVTVKINEPGRFFWVALPEGTSPGPLPADVLAGTGGQGSPAVSKGSAAIVDASKPVKAIMEGFEPLTTYDVYVLVQDAEDPPNTAKYAQMVKLQTEHDTTPPLWATGYPKVPTPTDTTAKFTLKLNERGNVHYALKLATGSALTVSDMRTPLKLISDGITDVAGIMLLSSSKLEFDLNLNDLQVNTSYVLYMLAVDDEKPVANEQTAVTVIPFRTLEDTTAPKFTNGNPSIEQDGKNVVLKLSLNEAGYIGYVIIRPPAGSVSNADVQKRAPTVAQVLVGWPTTKEAKVANGTVTTTSSSDVRSIKLPALAAETTYYLYLAAGDEWGNIQSSVAIKQFHTATTHVCFNGVQDNGEDDVDCGGTCGKCGVGAKCPLGGDNCAHGTCDPATKRCLPASCFDGVRNGNERTIDDCKTCPVPMTPSGNNREIFTTISIEGLRPADIDEIKKCALRRALASSMGFSVVQVAADGSSLVEPSIPQTMVDMRLIMYAHQQRLSMEAHLNNIRVNGTLAYWLKVNGLISALINSLSAGQQNINLGLQIGTTGDHSAALIAGLVAFGILLCACCIWGCWWNALCPCCGRAHGKREVEIMRYDQWGTGDDNLEPKSIIGEAVGNKHTTIIRGGDSSDSGEDGEEMDLRDLLRAGEKAARDILDRGDAEAIAAANAAALGSGSSSSEYDSEEDLGKQLATVDLRPRAEREGGVVPAPAPGNFFAPSAGAAPRGRGAPRPASISGSGSGSGSGGDSDSGSGSGSGTESGSGSSSDSDGSGRMTRNALAAGPAARRAVPARAPARAPVRAASGSSSGSGSDAGSSSDESGSDLDASDIRVRGLGGRARVASPRKPTGYSPMH